MSKVSIWVIKMSKICKDWNKMSNVSEWVKWNEQNCRSSERKMSKALNEQSLQRVNEKWAKL